MSHPDLVKSLEDEVLAFRQQASVYRQLADELAEALRVRGCDPDSCESLYHHKLVTFMRDMKEGIFQYGTR